MKGTLFKQHGTWFVNHDTDDSIQMVPLLPSDVGSIPNAWASRLGATVDFLLHAEHLGGEQYKLYAKLNLQS